MSRAQLALLILTAVAAMAYIALLTVALHQAGQVLSSLRAQNVELHQSLVNFQAQQAKMYTHQELEAFGSACMRAFWEAIPHITFVLDARCVDRGGVAQVVYQGKLLSDPSTHITWRR